MKKQTFRKLQLKRETLNVELLELAFGGADTVLEPGEGPAEPEPQPLSAGPSWCGCAA